MARIFVSHSSKDDELVGFFTRIFSVTNVKADFKGIEGFIAPQAWTEIQSDVQLSSAVFVLLGPHVQEIKYTRDWVVWESALGSPMRKDIWVFEPYESLGKIDVIIPHVDHYVVFQQTKQYQDYIKKIVESYDDSQVIAAATVGGIVGSLLAPIGSIGGALLGASATDPSRSRPPGILIECYNCHVQYRIHMRLAVIRCPTCNAQLQINWQNIKLLE